MNSVVLNNKAYQYAERLIKDGRVVVDDRDAWSEHQPTAKQENEYIKEYSWTAYSRWYLGVDQNQDEDNKGRYKFPYGDFEKVHRCGVLAAKVRAGQYKYNAIEKAADHLRGMMESLGNEK